MALDPSRGDAPRIDDPNSVRQLRPETKKWLFSLPDKIDRARGLDDTRRPSEYFLKYREYQLLYQLVDREVTSRFSKETWKLHPRLKDYADAESAKKGVLADWLMFGYRKQIDEALKEFNGSEAALQWHDWMRASEAFDRSRFPGGASNLANAKLSPSPSDWMTLATWRRVETPTKSGKMLSFQWTRIRIVREWLRLDMLSDGRLVTDREDQLSSGRRDGVLGYPTGPIAVVPIELLLIRNISGQRRHKTIVTIH